MISFKSTQHSIAILAVGLVLSACGAGGEEAPIPPAPPTGGSGSGGSGSGGGSGGAVSSDPASKIDTEVQASRFLSRSTFGGSKSDIADLIGSDAAAWVASEFAKPATLTLPTLSQYPLDNLGRPPRDTVDTLYWDHIISSDDQLRQRMAFALSQIIVYSDAGRINQLMRAYWQDILIRNAFGNFRDLLEEVTYSPAMGTWLTYASNRKSDERTGRMPDENYAREIMQLFSIGLVELNMDGTPKLDGSGRQIETYSNEDIEGLARVFTGLGYASGSFFAPSDGDLTQQMVMYPEYHSEAEKTFLGTTIPAGTSGEESIDLAIDTIFNHPNVAPFISRLLIQRFTQSDPAPQYVENVATAFETGRFVAEGGQEFGTGVRGDLEATLAAILLDPTMFEEPDAGATITSGKVREPILRFTHWARAFNVSGLDASNEQRLGDTKRTDVALGQQAFSSPSVFNFYRPGYVAPGTITGDQGMTIPEFQLVNESSIIGYMNFMTDFAFDIPSEYDRDNRTYTPDYSEELALVDDPEALVEHLDDLLTNGQMADAEKADIIDIISTIDIRESDPERNAADREEVVQAAVALFLISPAYAVTW